MRNSIEALTIERIILSIIRIDAILSMEGVAFKRHKDTLAYFNKQYIAKEVFPRDMGRKIVKAEEIRHASDYDTFYVASKEITVQQVETAECLLKLAREYYNKECDKIKSEA